MKKFILFLMIFLGNVWIWRILQLNLVVFILVSLESLLAYLFLFRKKLLLIFILFVLTLFLLLLTQWKTTIAQSLTLLDNDEQRIKMERLLFYNPSSHYMRLLFYKLNLKEFLEGDINTFSARVQRNIFETIDPNIYFFGGYPRARVWASDFEKFPFVLIVPFLVGLYNLFKYSKFFVLTSLIPSLILLSLIGHKNNLGPFVLLPFFMVCIFNGVRFLAGLLVPLSKVIRTAVIIISATVLILSIIQSFIYGF